MSAERTNPIDPRVQSAVDELEGLIRGQYPTATFEVSHGQDEPENIHLTATVDVDDPDEVLKAVIDRVVELQVEERIPIHVIPIRTPERILASMSNETRARRRLGRRVPLLGPVPPTGG
jgi:hypothetical protein